MRADNKGIFWTVAETSLTRASNNGRGPPMELLPVPDTGWRPPDNLPSLASAKTIAIDTETWDPDLRARGPGPRRGARVIGIAIATDNGYSNYFPIRHHPPTAEKFDPKITGNGNMNSQAVIRWLRKELGRSSQAKIGANILYDLDLLGADDIAVAGTCYDVQVAEPLLDDNATSYSLESLLARHLQEHKKEDELDKWGRKAWGEKFVKDNLWRTPAALVAPYAIGDVDRLHRLLAQQQQLMQQRGLVSLFDLETSLIPMLLAMRQRGIAVNVGRAEKALERLRDRYAQLCADIARIAGASVDVWSNGSIAEAFDHAGIEYPRTERGAPSFRKNWLKHHASPLAKLIVEARACNKMAETFLQSYVIDNHIDGRIHCQFHQLRGDGFGAISGRFSSSDPNLQNIPVRDPEFGPLLRSIFLADSDEVYTCRDWSQIEYRLIVHYAAIMKLPKADVAANAYRKDAATDFHQMVADIANLEREPAKTLNFGISYGEGAPKIAADLGVPLEQAWRIIRQYNQRCPFVRKLLTICASDAQDLGVITTLCGRQRHFDIWEDDSGAIFHEDGPGRQRAMTHKALNAKIQGSAADIMKKAMAKIWESGLCRVIGAPLLIVHDEFGLSHDRSKAAKEAVAELTNIMQTVVKLQVPLLASGGTGRNWHEAKLAG